MLLKNFFLYTLAAFFLFSACETAHDHGEEEGPAEDACEHMADGPAKEVTAKTDMSASLAAIAADHKRYDITLPADTVSYLTFEADEENDFVFALNDDLTFHILDADGTTLTAEDSDTGDLPCSEVTVMYTYELPEGTYILSLLATTQTSVSIVAVEGGLEHGH